MIKKTSTN